MCIHQDLLEIAVFVQIIKKGFPSEKKRESPYIYIFGEVSHRIESFLNRFILNNTLLLEEDPAGPLPHKVCSSDPNISII